MRSHARRTRWFFPAVPVPVLPFGPLAILQQLPPRRSPSGHCLSSLSPREEEPNHPPPPRQGSKEGFPFAPSIPVGS